MRLSGQWQLALNLFGEMLKERCLPNMVKHNSLITACAQAGALGCVLVCGAGVLL
jgi:pentatricopeptide repeat domain-containing protein 1